MYLSNTNETLEIVSDATATTTEPTYTFSYNDITSLGMTLPQSTSNGNMTGAVDVIAVSAPAAITTRQIIQGTIYNGDTVPHLITVKKDVGGTDYTIVSINLSVGMTLHYSREHNWSISGQDVNQTKTYSISEFTSNGTWNKPSAIKAALITCVGGGGGGGSGRMGLAGTSRFGGAGGGGAVITSRLVLGSALAASYAVTCATGGAGGASQTVNSTNGNPGAAGASTSFGALVIANGGGGGAGGTAVGASGGTAASVVSATPAYGPFSHSGSQGNNGGVNAQNITGNGMQSNTFTNGGSGGSGINASNVNSTLSNYAQGPTFLGTYKNQRETGGAVIQNINLSLLYHHQRSGTIGIGTGGTGGNATIINGTIGAYGSGGGGGAGVTDGSPGSGAGGAGGGGICLVMEVL